MDLAPEAESILADPSFLNEGIVIEAEHKPIKPEKHKRRSLSLGEKLAIIEEIEGGKNKNRLADERQLPRSTVFSIWDSRHKIKSANSIHGRHDGCKRLRPSGYDEVDQALYRWWLHARDKGMTISTNILLEKARSFAASLGVQFKNTGSWMDRFKIRHGIKGKSVGNHLDGEDTSIKRDEFVKELPSLTMGRNYRDIYCVNEMGLLYHVLPDINQIIGGTGNVASNKRITILLGTNMDGSDILPPLVIGNTQDLNSFGCTDSLSVSYCFNKSSLMTALIWRNWIKAFDRRMQSLQRHVILFSDLSPINFTVSDLKAVKVKFVHVRSTPFMPTKQGIMQRFKTWYRKLVLRDMVESMNDGVEFRMDMVSGLHFVRKAWEHISQDCVMNSFKVAGWTWDESYGDCVNYSDPPPSIAHECYKLNISESILSEIDKVEECLKSEEELTDQIIIDSVAAQHSMNLDAIEESGGEDLKVNDVFNETNISNGSCVGLSLAVNSASKPDLAEAKNAMKTLQDFLETFEKDSKPTPAQPRKRKLGRPRKRAEKKVVQKGKVMSLNPEKGVFEMTMTKIVKMEGCDDNVDLHMEC